MRHLVMKFIQWLYPDILLNKDKEVPEEENKFIDYDDVRVIKFPSNPKPEPVEIAIEKIDLLEDEEFHTVVRIFFSYKEVDYWTLKTWFKLSTGEVLQNGSVVSIDLDIGTYNPNGNLTDWNNLTQYERDRIYHLLTYKLSFNECMELLEKQKNDTEKNNEQY